jgi:hypothetical protein
LPGAKATNRCTYWSVVRPGGTLDAEGRGTVVSDEGDMATWVGQDLGTMNKWSRLNSVAAIYEYEVNAEWNSRSEFWEWK